MRKSVRKTSTRNRKNQKGFTLIELLVVVAILGVLAAVVIPNVAKFIGKGSDEAAKTELQNVQLSVTALMADSGSSTITLGTNWNADGANDQAGMDTVTEAGLITAGTHNLGEYMTFPQDPLKHAYDITTAGVVTRHPGT